MNYPLMRTSNFAQTVGIVSGTDSRMRMEDLSRIDGEG
jgi:hypothetical protein